MNRQPRLEAFLNKLHIPDFMYLSPYPADETGRHVKRQEKQCVVIKASGTVATSRMVELVPVVDSSLSNPRPDDASTAFFEPEPTYPEKQN